METSVIASLKNGERNDFVHLFADTADLAGNANCSGTFGVGGMLVDRHGVILKRVQNNVIENGRTVDPTNHVERKLVDWYLMTRQAETNYPPPDELTIITSLEPCMMCAGAILFSGLNVVAIAPDDFAGVGAPDRSFGVGIDRSYSSLPKWLRGQAEATFSFARIKGRQTSNKKSRSIFASVEIPESIYEKSVQAIAESLEKTRLMITNEENEITDIDSVGDVLSLLKRTVYDEKHILIGNDCSGEHCSTYHAQIGIEGGASLLTSIGAEHITATRTPLMELIRFYSKMRITAAKAGLSLPHPKRCSIKVVGRDTQDPRLIMELGAAGSFIEGPLPVREQPYLLFPHPQVEDIADIVMSFPPFYKDFVNITIGSV
jgi:tRNA(Arg) A34 adenosine deaminase TadA